jgi:hypothetical protein
MRIGPPDRPAEAVQRVHVVAGPSEAVCRRCGDEVVPRRFQAQSSTWPAFLLVQEARAGRSLRFITDDEAELFPTCER